MSSSLLLVLIPLAVAGIGLIAYAVWKFEQGRRARWQAWADQRGWTYQPGKDRGVGRYFEFINHLDRGDNRYADYILRGPLGSRPAIVFRYHYETRSTDSEGRQTTHHHWLWVVGLQIERTFPELRIAPENMGKRFLHAFTGSDIDFESIEFSRTYEVKSRDRRFAYDFCHSAMIDYLLTHRGTSLELEGSWLVMFGDGKLQVEEIDSLLDQLYNIRELMPDYLFR